jgi:hypothetical protein
MKCSSLYQLLIVVTFWAVCAAFNLGAIPTATMVRRSEIQKTKRYIGLILSKNQIKGLFILNQPYLHQHESCQSRKGVKLFSNVDDDNEDDDENVEPGMMRISEIKAELDLRNISYNDCFDKESLVQRLIKARKDGIADPSILEKFNKQNLEGIFRGESMQTMVKEITDSDIEAATANDGTIPGGLTPEKFKKLISNPEIMSALSSTKMQDAMKLMMTGNQDELEKEIENDNELREQVEKLDSILKSLS